MALAPSIFKSYDIRGIYPQEIDEEGIFRISQAIFAFFTEKLAKNNPTIVLGYDMRLSSPSLFAKAKETLLNLGANLIDVGLVSTPTFYFAVSHYGYDAGVQITASHNPKEYNGVKFVLNSPKGLIKIGKSTGMDQVKEFALSTAQANSFGKGSMIKRDNILKDEIKQALTLFQNPVLKKFRIVADPANAMGAQYIQAISEHIPMELIKMNFDLDGSFPSHQPDPLDFKNLRDLQARVISEKADFGLAPDGDGDRLFFIDEKGDVVPASSITALIAKELLRENPGSKILFDIRYILTPKAIVEEFGGTYEISKVGHAYITELMTSSGAIFAGESSAHYFFQSTGNAESQVATIICLLKILSEQKLPLSQIVRAISRSFESGEINFKAINASEILEKLVLEYKTGEISYLDGIAVSFPKWRFSLRTSNTEPLLRLNVEALEEKIMQENKNKIVDHIEKMIKKE
jgi:phosphomannomutase